jgi:hypothetical protein
MECHPKGEKMKERLFQFINDKFPSFIRPDIELRSKIRGNEISIPFELGGLYENGSDERVKQAINRVTTLFEELFNPNDMIYIFIKDYETQDDMFGNTTPQYVYDLLSKDTIEEEMMYELDKDYDDSDNIVEMKLEYKVGIVYSQLGSLPYKEIFQGISHYEQGREPSIGQIIYFISPDKDIIFHMYDDRGCRVYSDSTDKLQKIYVEFHHWIGDYYRKWVDSMFK